MKLKVKYRDRSHREGLSIMNACVCVCVCVNVSSGFDSRPRSRLGAEEVQTEKRMFIIMESNLDSPA